MYWSEFLLSSAGVGLFCLYLWGEKYYLSRNRKSLPLRIAVTGSRGKSTVTRIIASILREAGFSPMAKTTGSKPVLIYPDGKEREIKRHGLTSILEVKKFIKLCSQEEAGASVCELMSIHPESLQVESCQIFQPHYLVITNVRLDHIQQQGETKEEIASSLSLAIPPHSTVIIPQEECRSAVEEAAYRRKACLIQVSRKDSVPNYFQEKISSGFMFEENVRLSEALAGLLGIEPKFILQGLRNYSPDFGALKAWRMQGDISCEPWICVNIFAANDPESTRVILDRLKKKSWSSSRKIVALLNLRPDRGDRTYQWIEAVQRNLFPEFKAIYLTGQQAVLFKRKTGSFFDGYMNALKPMSAQQIIETIFNREKEPGILAGIGNIGGRGKDIVDFWERKGEKIDR